MQDYLKSKSGVNSFQAKQIFCLRSHALDVSSNFTKKYGMVKVCVCGNKDDQLHCYSCLHLHDKQILPTSRNITYYDIYGCDMKKQLLVSQIVMSGFEKRKQKMSSLFSGEDPDGSRTRWSGDPGCHEDRGTDQDH